MDGLQNCRMGQAHRPTCPDCGAYLTLALPPGADGPRTFQCLDGEGPDPINSPHAIGWLAGELGKPTSAAAEQGRPVGGLFIPLSPSVLAVLTKLQPKFQ